MLATLVVMISVLLVSVGITQDLHTLTWNVVVWALMVASALYMCWQRRFSTPSFYVFQMFSLAGLTQLGSFTGFREQSELDSQTWACVGITLGLVVLCQLCLAASPGVYGSELWTPALACHAAAGGLLAWALTKGEATGGSADASVSRLLRVSGELAATALADVTHILALLPLVPVFAFLAKYAATWRKNQLDSQAHDHTDYKLPDATEQLRSSQAIAFPIMLVMVVFIFLRVLQSTGLVADAVSLWAAPLVVGFGWSMRDWLSAICIGVMINFSTCVGPGKRIRMTEAHGGQTMVVDRLGLMFAECLLEDGIKPVCARTHDRVFVPYSLMLHTVFTVSVARAPQTSVAASVMSNKSQVITGSCL